MKSVYLLTGLPGTGKTTLIKNLTAGNSINAGGFYTEEIRAEGTRQGFRIVTLDGQTATFAHTNIRGPYRVSKYGIDCAELEKTGVAALQKAALSNDLVVIDEIGKMELFSDLFYQTVTEIVDSGKRVLGTIMLRPHPRADIIKSKPQVQLITLTRQNGDKVFHDLQEWLKEMY